MKKELARLGMGACLLLFFCGCTKNAEKQEETGRTYDPADYVTLGEYKGLEVTVEKSEVTDADVQTYIENMIANYPIYTETDKQTVENGDVVNIDYEGLLDGEAFDGGTASDQYLEIGSGTFIDGFEEGLVGAGVGSTVSLDLTFPDPYSANTDLSGKAVVFNVTIRGIVTETDATYDTLTDEYVAKNFSSYGFTTVDGMKSDVREYLESENESTTSSNLRSAVLDALSACSSVDSFPEGLLDERVTDYKERFETMCQENYSMTVSEFLSQNYQKTEEEFNEDVITYMKENLESELLLLAIAEKEELEVDEDGYSSFLSSMMSNYGYSSEEDLYAEYDKSYVQDSYLCNKALTLLSDNAVVTYTQTEDSSEE